MPPSDWLADSLMCSKRRKRDCNLNPEDDIVAGCVLTRDGAIVNDAVRQA